MIGHVVGDGPSGWIWTGRVAALVGGFATSGVFNLAAVKRFGIKMINTPHFSILTRGPLKDLNSKHLLPASICLMAMFTAVAGLMVANNGSESDIRDLALSLYKEHSLSPINDQQTVLSVTQLDTALSTFKNSTIFKASRIDYALWMMKEMGGWRKLQEARERGGGGGGEERAGGRKKRMVALPRLGPEGESEQGERLMGRAAGGGATMVRVAEWAAEVEGARGKGDGDGSQPESSHQGGRAKSSSLTADEFEQDRQQRADARLSVTLAAAAEDDTSAYAVMGVHEVTPRTVHLECCGMALILRTATADGRYLLAAAITCNCPESGRRNFSADRLRLGDRSNLITHRALRWAAGVKTGERVPKEGSRKSRAIAKQASSLDDYRLGKEQQ